MKLQTEITNDEELLKFLEKKGLALLDVYSEWCGPCLAMVSNLQKIKLGIGQDNLHLATCKSDTIDVFKQYRQKSMPVWLFATQGKLVNITYGCDVPKLMSLIEKELLMLDKTERTFYKLTDVVPEITEFNIFSAQNQVLPCDTPAEKEEENEEEPQDTKEDSVPKETTNIKGKEPKAVRKVNQVKLTRFSLSYRMRMKTQR